MKYLSLKTGFGIILIFGALSVLYFGWKQEKSESKVDLENLDYPDNVGIAKWKVGPGHIDYSGNSSITDRDIKKLAGRSDIEYLDLAGTTFGRRPADNAPKITDKALEYIGTLVNLRGLDLNSCMAISDNGVASLRNLEKLEELDFNYCPITIKGVSYLRSHKNLKFLSLRMCHKIEGDALIHLKGLRNLQELHLSFTSVSDEELRHLVTLENLDSLWLTFTSISDNGLQYIEKLRGLKTLELSVTDVTDQGIAKLQKALPECKITAIILTSRIVHN